MPVSRVESIGLCASCQHSRTITSSKGAAFTRCELSFTDPRFERYPALPVIRCEGYTAQRLPSSPEEDEHGSTET